MHAGERHARVSNLRQGTLVPKQAPPCCAFPLPPGNPNAGQVPTLTIDVRVRWSDEAWRTGFSRLVLRPSTSSGRRRRGAPRIGPVVGRGWLCKSQPCVRSAGGGRTYTHGTPCVPTLMRQPSRGAAVKVERSSPAEQVALTAASPAAPRRGRQTEWRPVISPARPPSATSPSRRIRSRAKRDETTGQTPGPEGAQEIAPGQGQHERPLSNV